MPSLRQDFNKDVRDRLAIRVCYKCSLCRCPTAGPAADESGRVMVGVAAHICAASPNGPRYDPAQSEVDRRSIPNGIWLCATCAKLIDDDVARFPISELHRIKGDAERRATQELAIAPAEGASNWQALQSSKICSYEVQVKLPLAAGGEDVAPAHLDAFTDSINKLVTWAFCHTCVTTPFDDFVYVLAFERDRRDCEPGYAPFILGVHCHITAFVWAFEGLARHFMEGGSQPSLQSLPGEQVVRIAAVFDKCVPTRICRTGATSILIHQLSDERIGLDGPVNTSTLLRVLAASVNHKILIWDDADLCPDYGKMLATYVKINDAGGFNWSDFMIDRAAPESWRYVGP